MQPLIQSALDAANRGEKNKALELCKQALAANPNDVNAWLVIAAIVDQPERKRQCLNRVLSLDPTNQIARDELLQMDRAAMGALPPSAPKPVTNIPQSSLPQVQVTYPSAPSPSTYSASTSAFESAPAIQQSMPLTPQMQTKAAPGPVPKARAGQTLVLRSPLLWRIVMYFFVVMFGCFGLLMVVGKEVVNGLVFLVLTFLMGIGAMALSKKVEVSDSGIRASGVLGSSEIEWNEIKSLRSSSMKQRLELYKSDGQVVKVSNQVSGYPKIIEILRQKRPDLFGISASGYEQTFSGSPASSAPAFSGAKTFRKSFIRQYGLDFILVFFCLLFIWLGLQDPQYRLASFLTIGFCLLFIIATLFQVNAIKVEPNRLTIETLFEQRDFSARQIKEIKMQSVRGRYGRVTHYVLLTTAEGKKYSLGGFSDGEDIIYGFLMNWWNAYKNQ